MQVYIALIDFDMRYAKMLLEVYTKSKLFHIRLYSSYEIYQESDIKSNVLLIDENMYQTLEEKPDIPCILLTCERFFNRTENDKRILGRVFRYQSIEQIERDILRLYSGDDNPIYIQSTTDKHILGIYSPVARCGKTVLSIFLAMQSPQSLYISFSEYKDLYNLIETYDLSDLLYAHQRGDLSWDKINRALTDFEGLKFIPTARFAEDIYDFPISDYGDFLKELQEKGDFTYLIIDFANLGKRSIDILDICEKIYLPSIQGEVYDKRIEEFYACIEKKGISNLKEKIEKVYLPELDLEDYRPSKIQYCVLKDWIKEVM